MAGTLPSDFKPAKTAVLKLTFGVSGTAANTDEGAEPFLAGTHPHIAHSSYTPFEFIKVVIKLTTLINSDYSDLHIRAVDKEKIRY